MKILKETVSVVVEFDKEDLKALSTVLGSMSTKEYKEFGASDYQAELLYAIYCELSDYVDDED